MLSVLKANKYLRRLFTNSSRSYKWLMEEWKEYWIWNKEKNK